MSHLVSPAAPGKKATGTDLRRYMRELGDYMELAATGTLAAAEAGADVILANAIAPYAYDVAEALGVPAIGAHLQPTEPSTAYPPVVLGTARSLGPVGNKLLGSLIAAGKAPYDAPSAGSARCSGCQNPAPRPTGAGESQQPRSPRHQPHRIPAPGGLAIRTHHDRLLVAGSRAGLAATGRAARIPRGRTAPGLHRLR